MRLLALRLVLVLLIGVSGWIPGTPIMAASPPAVTSYCFDREIDDGRVRPVCIGLKSYTADVCTAIERYAAISGLPVGYFARLVWQESHFDANAMSFAGAQGIAQFMPGTARALGLADPFDAEQAIDAQAHLMRDLLRRFAAVPFALAAYNAGPAPVAACMCVPPYAETRGYVARILGLLGGAGDSTAGGLEVRLVA